MTGDEDQHFAVRTLTLRTSLRESAEPCEVCCYDSRRNQFLVSEKGALRLFSTCRQIRSFHLSRDRANRVVAVYMIKDLDAYAIILAGADNVMEAARLQLWTSALYKLCEMELVQCSSTILYSSINGAMNELVIAGSDFISVYKLAYSVKDASSIEVQSKPPPSTSSSSSALGNFKANHIVTLESSFNVSGGIHYLGDGESIVVLCKQAIMLMLRCSSSEEEGSNGFKLHKFEHLWDDAAVTVSPTAFLQCNEQHLVTIGFSDGSLRVYLCRAPDTSEGTFRLLYHFREEFGQPSPAILSMCRSTLIDKDKGGHFEFFASSMKRITHWCLDVDELLRLQISSSPSSDHPHSSSEGHYSTSTAKGFLRVKGYFDYGKHFGNWMFRKGTPHLVAFETVDDFGLSRGASLFFSCGGVVGFLFVHEGLRAIVKSVDGISTLCCDDESERLFVAKDTCIDIYDDLLGSRRNTDKCSATLQLSTFFGSIMNPGSVSGSGGANSIAAAAAMSRNRAVSSIHWSSLLNQLIIGTSDGHVASFVISENQLQLWSHRKAATETQNRRVTVITSLLLPNKKKPKSTDVDTYIKSKPAVTEEDSCAVIICDDSGTLSVWRAFPTSHQHSKASPGKVCFSCKAHMGSIFYARECVVPELKLSGFRFLITACSQGYVKCWTVAANGGMKLSAYFDSQMSISALFCSRFSFTPETNQNSSSRRQQQHSLAARIICICGSSHGEVHVWMLSSDSSQTAASGALFTVRIGSSAIVSISEDYRQNRGETESPSVDGRVGLNVLCAMSDGTIVPLTVLGNGEPFVQPRNILSFPLQIHDVFGMRGGALLIRSQSEVFATAVTSTDDGDEFFHLSEPHDEGMRSAAQSPPPITATTAAPVDSKLTTAFLPGPGLQGSSENTPTRLHEQQLISSAASDDNVFSPPYFASSSSSVLAASFTTSNTEGLLLPERMPKSYAKMGQNRISVTYNSVGDAVRNEVRVTQGMPHGRTSQLRSYWQSQHILPKVCTSNATSSVNDCPRTILRQLPEEFSRFINKDIELPALLSPTNDHWFDVRRTIRIVRTILDVRASKQREVSLSDRQDRSTSRGNNLFSEAEAHIESPSKSLITYFERQYGAGGLNVSHQKAVNFLEALLQYSDVPVVKVFLSFVYPPPTEEVTSALSNVMMWLYVEARAYFYSKDLVLQGDAINVYGGRTSADNEEEKVNNSSNRNAVCWQLIRRSDALNCVDELVRCRGQFGPLSIQRMLLVVDGLAASSIPPQQLSGSSSVLDEQSLSKQHSSSSALAPSSSKQMINRTSQSGYISLKSGSRTIDSLPAAAVDLIDLEVFLGALVVELLEVFGAINSLTDEVFGEQYSQSKSLQWLSGLLGCFVDKDPSRTGKISVSELKDVMMRSYAMPAEHAEHRIQMLDMCLKNYICGPAGDLVSYVDLWATLLSYFVQNQEVNSTLNMQPSSAAAESKNDLNECEIENTSSSMMLSSDQLWNATLDALRVVKRGLEDSHASAVLGLVGYMSSVPYIREDPSWLLPQMASVLGGNRNRQSEEQGKAYKQSVLPCDGDWVFSLSSSIEMVDENSSFDPLLFSQGVAIPLQMVSRVRHQYNDVKSGRTAAEVETIVGPLMLQTGRDMVNEYGEVCRPTGGPVDQHLSRHELSQLTIPLDISDPKNDGHDEPDRPSRASYSRSMCSLTKPPFQEYNDKQENEETFVRRIDMKFKSAHSTNASGFRGEKQQSLRQNQSLNFALSDVNSFPLESESRASDEASRLRLVQVEREKLLLLMMAEEERRMQSLRHKKKQSSFREKKESISKEQESLKMKIAADNKRDEARERARRLLEEKRKRDEEAERKRQEELKAAMDAERERKLLMKQEKAKKELEAENRRREGQETLLMTKEDSLSANVRRLLKRMKEEAAFKAQQEEQNRIQKEIRRRLEEEKAKELMETSLMHINDIRHHFQDEVVDLDVKIPVRDEHTTDLAESDSVEEGDLCEEELSDPGSVLEESNNEIDCEMINVSSSAFQRRVQLLAENVSNGIDNLRTHSRKQTGVAAFFPLSFSADITWNPFQSTATDTLSTEKNNSVSSHPPFSSGQLMSEQHLASDFEMNPPCADFSDISRLVTRRKHQVEKGRIRQLYQTTEVSPSQWTKVFAKSSIDWNQFFHEENKSRNNTDMNSEVDLRRKEEQKWISERLKYVHQSRFSPLPSPTMATDTNRARSPLVFIPLPFTKVYNGVAEINCPEYFQIITTINTCLVTVELQCRKGFADVYVGLDSVPTTASYFAKGITNEENGRIARIVLKVDGSRKIIAAVVSNSTGSEFELWACQSSQSVVQPTALQHASSLVQTFNALSENSIEDLSLRLPGLHSDAHKSVAANLNMIEARRDSVIRRLNRTTTDRKTSDGELLAVLETFIAKKGRSIMKAAGAQDPNDHSDLFPKFSENENELLERGNLLDVDLSTVGSLFTPFSSEIVKKPNEKRTKNVTQSSLPLLLPVTYKLRKIV